MKNIILFILLCFTTSAFADTFTCVSSLNGKELSRASAPVTEDGLSMVELGMFRDVELSGETYFGQVSAFMVFDGVIYGSIAMGAASYKLYMIGTGELQLDCFLE